MVGDPKAADDSISYCWENNTHWKYIIHHQAVKYTMPVIAEYLTHDYRFPIVKLQNQIAHIRLCTCMGVRAHTHINELTQQLLVHSSSAGWTAKSHL